MRVRGGGGEREAEANSGVNIFRGAWDIGPGPEDGWGSAP